MSDFLEKLRMYGLGTSLSYALNEIKNRTVTRYLKGSYSQTGEDLVIDELLGHKENGFYIGIGRCASRRTFFMFIPDTLSTFSAEEAERYEKQGYRLAGSAELELRRLDSVLSEHCEDAEIDFMSVDTEGFDLEVLKSNDWRRFKPTVVCIESVKHRANGAEDKRHVDCERLLTGIGYRKVHDNGLNSTFVFREVENE